MRRSGWFVVMALDDLTVAARVDDVAGNPPVGMAPLMNVPGRPQTFGVSRHGNSLFVTYTPATHVVTCRVSVPRWLHQHPVNFPLVPVESVEGLRPRRLAVEIAHALGLRVSAIGPDAEEIVPVRSMAVIRASYAVDLQFDDPLGTVLGLMGIQRRNGALFKAFGRPRVSTVEWAAKSLSAKFYAKGIEVLTHKGRNDTQNGVIEQLASDAQNSLRFEVAFKQVVALRRLFGAGLRDGLLPTLALMCDPRVGRWVLTREADRLRLFERYESLERTTFPVHVRHVVSRLRTAQTRLAAGGRTLGRRHEMTQERLNKLTLAYFYSSGCTTDEVASLLSCSPSSVRELVSDLRALGIPPDNSPFATLGAAVRDVADQLEPHLLDEYPPDLSDWRERGPFVRAPWLETVIDENDVVDEPDEDPVDDVDTTWLDSFFDTSSAVEDIGISDPVLTLEQQDTAHGR